LAFVSFSLTGIARMEETAAVEAVEVVAKVLIMEPKKSSRMDVEEVWRYTM
jgi:hypothetical protein